MDGLPLCTGTVGRSGALIRTMLSEIAYRSTCFWLVSRLRLYLEIVSGQAMSEFDFSEAVRREWIGHFRNIQRASAGLEAIVARSEGVRSAAGEFNGECLARHRRMVDAISCRLTDARYGASSDFQRVFIVAADKGLSQIIDNLTFWRRRLLKELGPKEVKALPIEFPIRDFGAYYGHLLPEECLHALRQDIAPEIIGETISSVSQVSAKERPREACRALRSLYLSLYFLAAAGPSQWKDADHAVAIQLHEQALREASAPAVRRAIQIRLNTLRELTPEQFSRHALSA